MVTHTWAKLQDTTIKYIVVKKLVSLIFIVSIMWNSLRYNPRVQNLIFWVGWCKVRLNLESNKKASVICVAPRNGVVIFIVYGPSSWMDYPFQVLRIHGNGSMFFYLIIFMWPKWQSLIGRCRKSGIIFPSNVYRDVVINQIWSRSS